ncbi:signal peptidase I [Mycetocola reblochoni]|uniref:signal peptidase I n=1 Tax=Mycetocola reblochoni TaxID=331618 RepID=UPI001FE6BBE9|nr:signal peptidase I [Mycetocola reblochoni]
MRPRRPARRSGFLGFLRDLVIIVVVAVVISFVVKTFLVRSFYIPSGSMENTLQIDDRILVNQLVPEVVGLERGDVVVFKDPGGWLEGSGVPPTASSWLTNLIGLTSPDDDEHLIKRVIGLPGDHVECCNASGQLSVNGVPISEPYVLLPAGKESVSEREFDVTVPEGSLWVLGDNRYNSADSRYNQDKPGQGFVPVENVVGRAFVISWPVSRWSVLGNYPEVFRGVPDTADAGE